MEWEVATAVAASNSNKGGTEKYNATLNVGTDDKEDGGALEEEGVDKDDNNNPTYEGENWTTTRSLQPQGDVTGLQNAE